MKALAAMKRPSEAEIPRLRTWQSEEEKSEMLTRFVLSVTGNIRFRCDRTTGCWIWISAVAPNGYGRIGYQGRVVQAHRYAYTVVRGEVPNDMDLDHLCRNRRCVNPWHLEIVTRAINARRGQRAKLTQEQVDTIRARWARRECTQTAMGKEYGVGSDIISEIVNWKIWR